MKAWIEIAVGAALLGLSMTLNSDTAFLAALAGGALIGLGLLNLTTKHR